MANNPDPSLAAHYTIPPGKSTKDYALEAAPSLLRAKAAKRARAGVGRLSSSRKGYTGREISLATTWNRGSK